MTLINLYETRKSGNLTISRPLEPDNEYDAVDIKYLPREGDLILFQSEEYVVRRVCFDLDDDRIHIFVENSFDRDLNRIKLNRDE